MWRILRHRQPAQIGLIAPFAVIALMGIVGLVVDFGVFRLIDSELENAADAAALAAAWYDPVCPTVDHSSDPTDPVAADSRCPPTAPDSASAAAQRFASYNLGLAASLCGTPPVIDPVKDVLVHPIHAPNARGVTVIIHCRAGYFAGRILGLGSTEITRWATAALGEEQNVKQPDGTVRQYLRDYAAYPGAYTPPAPLIARLVPL